MLESMDVIGILVYVGLQLKEVILIVLYGLESMGLIGIKRHALVQLDMVILTV